MTGGETYTAWNGDDYPWPPPPDWYLAIDGRWWPEPDDLDHPDETDLDEVDLALPVHYTAPEIQYTAPKHAGPGEVRDPLDANPLRRHRRASRLPFVLGVAVVAMALGFFAVSFADNPETLSEEARVQSPTSAVRQEQPLATPSAVPGGSIEGETPCPQADGSSARTTFFDAPPPTCIDATKSYQAQIETSQGQIVVDLDSVGAPIAVNNFVVLARYHFYDGVWFHRIIPRFVIQGGDANGRPLGSGDPGYAFSDELPGEGAYSIGSVAMANSGPDTNGSQFFIVTGDLGLEIPPQYTQFGQVVEGLDVVAALEATPTREGDSPTEQAIIDRITIIES